MAELLDAGATLQQAQQAALSGQPGTARELRIAHAHLRAAIARLTQRAETLLVRAGHAASDATLQRLAATLQAAATGTRRPGQRWRRGGSPATWTQPGSASLPHSRPSRPPTPDPRRPRPGLRRILGGQPRSGRGPDRQQRERLWGRGGRSSRPRRALAQTQAAADRQQQAALVARQHAAQLADRAEELQVSGVKC
jgi:hypothetical protein